MKKPYTVLVVGASLAAASIGASAVSRALSQASPITVLRTPDGGIQPQVAVDANGRIHLIYFKGEPAHGDLFYVRLGNDGTFSRPVQVNTTPGSAIATGTIR